MKIPALIGSLTRCAVMILAAHAASLLAQTHDVVRLDGQWRFELDRRNAGIQEAWYGRALSGKVKLPGSLPAQGIGDDVSLETKWVGGADARWVLNPIYAPYTNAANFKFPFWLQPDKYYAGAAWYQRDIEIPAKWEGKRVVLSLERAHWETRVWVDGTLVGTNQSLFTPHEYDLGTHLTLGKHQLTIRVDNSLVVDVGINSHCVTDHTQGNWNGIVGGLLLKATPPLWIDDLQVYPQLDRESVLVRGRIGNATGKAGTGTLTLRADEAVERGTFGGPQRRSFQASWGADGGTFSFELQLPGAKPWDEFHQNLFNLEARLEASGDWKTVSFGFRQISTQGTQFLVNGRKAFFRGTLECCIFPLTGHPPVEVDAWRKVIGAAKAHGLNLLRFHSYCPPEAAFVAADELGCYLQVETSWANDSTTIGDGKPVDRWVYDETDRILKAYGNHPSFVLMLYGNEPGGKQANAYLAEYVNHFKAKDSRRLWSSGSGWPQLPENQFHVTPDPRIQGWGEGLKSRINARPPETLTDYRDYIQKRQVPVISHEIGQWCVYPNFNEIQKYTGYLKARNFEIFRDTLRAHHMGGQARDFLIASGKLQTLCYKEDIESALRTPGMGGFELLDLHDFPGQGTALVGVLDPFWEYKGYVTARQYRRFCDSTVPLARLAKRIFTSDEKLRADIEVAHFGAEPWKNAVAIWRLEDTSEKTVAQGRLQPKDLPIDNGIGLGTITVDLAALKAPARYTLLVKLSTDTLGGQPYRGRPLDVENDWDIWIYPPKVETKADPKISIASDLDEQALAALKSGGKVLLMIPPGRVKGDALGKVALGFSSIFWNTAWTSRQPPHTLGILCDPKNPALSAFPTEFHSNWQWWHLISRAGAMILDDMPADLRPTVQVIDDWVTNRRLGLVFEANVAGGKLLVCSIDLNKDTDTNPVARQMLHSLLDYMGGSKFKPRVSVTPDQIRGLMEKP